MKWLKKYYLYIVLFGFGLILTSISIRAAYIQRGYFAIGGEWLIIPLALMIVIIINELKEAKNDYIIDAEDENISIDTADSGIKKDA